MRNRGYARLTISVGVDDSATDAQSAAVFEVYGDGRLLARSAPLKRGAAAQPLTVVTRGVQLVELVARAPGAINEQLPVSWSDAAFHR